MKRPENESKQTKDILDLMLLLTDDHKYMHTSHTHITQ